MFRKNFLITCYSKSSMDRIKIILKEYSLKSEVIENFDGLKKIDFDTIAVSNIIIKNGFESEDLIIITEQDLFG